MNVIINALEWLLLISILSKVYIDFLRFKGGQNVLYITVLLSIFSDPITWFKTHLPIYFKGDTKQAQKLSVYSKISVYSFWSSFVLILVLAILINFSN